jgi:endoglucanase
MSLDLVLLKQLSEVAAIPGWEDRAVALVQRVLKPKGGPALADEIRTDAMGNLIARKAGKGPRVMVAAHLDEIGFYVKHIDKDGFLRVQPAGGFDTRNLFARRVVVHAEAGDLQGLLNSAAKPIHISTAEERNHVPLISEFFIDLGLPAGEVQQKVTVGDPVTLWQEALPIGRLFCGKAMDDRASAFVLIETLKRLSGKKLPFDLYAVFTAQEEVGLRGALTSAYGLEPDIGIALDVTLAIDIPEVKKHLSVSQMGHGVGIKVMDSSMISHRSLVKGFVALAKKKKIPYQMEVLPLGGTDAGAIQRSRGGVPSITLSIPTRYIHTVVEAVHLDDVEATTALLTAYLLGK